MKHYRKIIFFAAALMLVNAWTSDISYAKKSHLSSGSKKTVFGVNHRLGMGLTYHKAHSDFEDLPFGDGDLSYGLCYEYHEGIGYWQIGVDYTPTVHEYSLIDHVVTPHLSLIIKDRIYRAGLGILKSYISDRGDVVEDTEIYYQGVIGLGFPLFSQFSLDISSMYSFEKWRDIDFEFKDIEFGLNVTYGF